MATSEKTAIERQKISPRQLARTWGVSYAKILALIEAGQLTAINTAIDPDGTPRFLIDLQAIEAFERKRSSVRSRTVSF